MDMIMRNIGLKKKRIFYLLKNYCRKIDNKISLAKDIFLKLIVAIAYPEITDNAIQPFVSIRLPLLSLKFVCPIANAVSPFRN